MRFLFLFLFASSAISQVVDENKVNEWFTNCKITSSDIGEHNAGTAQDVRANYPSSETDDEVKTYVAMKHGLGWNVSITAQTYNYLNDLISRAVAQGASIETGRRIVVEGESTTAGTSSFERDAWGERLMRRANWVGSGIFINQAANSQSVAEITSQYIAQVYPFRPGQNGITDAWLFVMIGIKDAGTGRSAAQILADVESYVTTAKSHGFTVVVLTTMYNNVYTSGQKQVILDYNAAILNSTVPDYVIDAVTAIGQPDVEPGNYVDSVHPNGFGFNEIADEINSTLSPTP